MVCNCLRDYIEDQWDEDNCKRPDTIAVIDAEISPGKFLGTQSSGLLINRGEIQFFTQDIGASSTDAGERMRQWRTSIFIHEPDSRQTQATLNEFTRIMYKWQAGGGGAFSTDDTDELSYIQNLTEDFRTDKVVNVYLTLNGFYEVSSI